MLFVSFVNNVHTYLRFNKFLHFCNSDEWYIFSGNELGALLGWWMMHKYQVQHPDTDFSNVYMLASTVSSKILASMAKHEGFNFEVSMMKINLKYFCYFYSYMFLFVSKGNFNRF